ncbi:hypothetical protein ACQPW3_25905 [Actinosynnema sp. CA-248983]
MDITLAHEKLVEVLKLIDEWGDLYNRRWGKVPPYTDNDRLAAQVDELHDRVRARTRLAQDIILAMAIVNSPRRSPSTKKVCTAATRSPARG